MLFLNYIANRLLQMMPVIFGISLVGFFAIHLVPGDPIQIMMHGHASPESVAAARAQLGLDRPLLEQYGRFVMLAVTGDFGQSIVQRQAVGAIVGERVLPTVFLLSYSTVLAILIALPLALISARYSDHLVDHAIRIGGMVGFAMPPFWVGLLLMLFFGLYLRWLPVSGLGNDFADRVRHLLLPSATIALFLAPILVQSLRSAMLEVMTADYIEVARAKGLTPRRILLKHVLRNALIPVITILAVNIGWLLSGAVIVEYVFSYPGLGSLLVRAVSYRDYPVIQGLSIVFGVLVVIVNLMADLSYILVDRRVLKK
jgi:peptide/nickel transport system permease protein